VFYSYVSFISNISSKPDFFFSGNRYTSVGHGGSDGLHAYVHSLDDAVSDMVCSRTYKCFVGYCLNKKGCGVYALSLYKLHMF